MAANPGPQSAHQPAETPNRLIDLQTIDDLRAAAPGGNPEVNLAMQAAELANTGPDGASRASAMLAALSESSQVSVLFLGFQFFFRMGDLQAAERWARRRVQIVESDDLLPSRARAHTNLGLVLLAKREPTAWSEAVAHLEKAVEISARLNDQAGLSRDLGNLANAFEEAGDLAKAAELNRQGLAIARSIGSAALALTKLANLGDIAARQGDIEAAKVQYTEALALMEQTGQTKWLAEYRAKLAALG